MLLEPLGLGAYLHALIHSGHAGGQQLVTAFDLHQAQAAGAYIAQALKMAERGNIDVVLPRHLQNGLAGAGADFLPIDLKSFDAHIFTHANTSFSTATGAAASMEIGRAHV